MRIRRMLPLALLTMTLLATLLTSVSTRAAAGPGWSVVSSPNPSAQDILQSVSGISNSDVWAVGVQFTVNANYSEFTLAEHWDGTSWSAVPTPNPGSNGSACGVLYQNDLTAVAEISANDVWAVGQYCTPNGSGDILESTLAEHWDGTQWTVVPSPNPSQYCSLFGVAALASNNVWAVGQNYASASGLPATLIEHWDGTSWSVVPSPNPPDRTAYLQAVAAAASNDIWAVGYSGSTSQQIPLIEHYNGSKWTIVSAPYVHSSPFNELNNIAVIAPNDVWAVGYENYDGKDPGQTGLFEHWNGKAWSLISAPPVGVNGELAFWGIAPVSSNNVWAFGSTWNQNLDMVPLIEHWNGEKWAVVNAPDPGKSGQLFSATTLQGEIWAVGDYGTQPGGDPPSPLTLVLKKTAN